MEITLWVLNEAETLMHGRTCRFGPLPWPKSRPYLEELERNGIGGGIGVMLGRRARRAYNPASGTFENTETEPGILMHEGSGEKDFDEYWVPIPLKCLGDLPTKAKLTGEAKRTLDGIYKRYDLFKPWEDFWDLETVPGGTRSPAPGSAVENADRLTKSLPFGNVRMTTPEYKGYYEILKEYPNNVLVGYSQGGLVARYLAFLDEHVLQSDPPVIKAVITIGSPNYGSPMANPANADSVMDGVASMLLTLGTFWQDDYPRLHDIVKPSFDETFDALRVAYEEAKSESKLKSLLETTLKWASGLQNQPFSAFDELDIWNYPDLNHPSDVAFSVLNLINTKPLKHTYQGAIINANNTLEGIARAQLGWKYRLANWWGRIGGKRLDDYLGEVSGIYSRDVMEETRGPDNPIVAGLKQSYTKGWNTWGEARIQSYAHDFVIPSCYQVLPKPSDENLLLGQVVNPKANHNSGRLPNAAGARSLSAVKQMLGELAKRIEAG